MKLPPSELCSYILSLHNIYGIHYYGCTIINRVIIISMRMRLTRIKIPTLACPLSNPEKRPLTKWKLSINDGMFLLVNHRVAVIFSKFYPHTHLLILKDVPNHSMGSVMLSNYEGMSQLVTKVSTRTHSTIFLKFYPIVTDLPCIASLFSEISVSWK